MKKDRNCGGNASVYPTYPGMMPGAMPNPNMNYSPNYGTGNYGTTDDISRLKEQVQMLDRRVSRLENMLNDSKNMSYNNSKFSDTNYHIM